MESPVTGLLFRVKHLSLTDEVLKQIGVTECAKSFLTSLTRLRSSRSSELYKKVQAQAYNPNARRQFQGVKSGADRPFR